jgi:RND family efflux transporter MFP subunit
MNWLCRRPDGRFQILWLTGCLIAVLAAGLTACGKNEKVRAEIDGSKEISVGITKVSRKTLERQLTVSSELVPFQEIDVYAKESGYVRDLLVDYGTRVKKGQVIAVLEIPELEVQLQQDDAAIRNASDQVTRAEHELGRVEAQHKVVHLQFDRLNGVAKSKPGLSRNRKSTKGKDLAAEAQVDATKASLQSAQSQLQGAEAKKEHDQVLFNYSKITAPFAGVITQRFANLGALVQAGTSSSTQAMPLVRLSQDDRFRLVIPVPESYVRYIKIGESVSVTVPSLSGGVFPGEVARFSVGVKEDTRTMHTEVDVLNTKQLLIPGMYAEATLTLERKVNAVSVPLQAIDHEGDKSTVEVVNQANRIETRTVTLGLQTARDAEVVSGLSGDEQVVVSDRSGLKPGEQVRPQQVQVLNYQGQKEE